MLILFISELDFRHHFSQIIVEKCVPIVTDSMRRRRFIILIVVPLNSGLMCFCLKPFLENCVILEQMIHVMSNIVFATNPVYCDTEGLWTLGFLLAQWSLLFIFVVKPFQSRFRSFLGHFDCETTRAKICQKNMSVKTSHSGLLCPFLSHDSTAILNPFSVILRPFFGHFGKLFYVAWCDKKGF